MPKTFKTNQSLINTGFNQISGGTLSLSGNTLIGRCGTLKYATDQHAKYTARSVVDAAYITGKTTAILNIGCNQQVIYRDVSGITGATDFFYDKALSGVTVPNLSISITPADTASNYVLTWNECSCKVNKLHASCAIGLSSAVNGLSVFNNCATLGGTLICDTVVNGCDSYSLGFCNLCFACIGTTRHNIVIDSQCNTGGIYLKSQTGTISTETDFCNSVGISVNYNASHGFAIYDNRPLAFQSGIEYANNYASFYTLRSLVDKEYVDTVATGLKPHPAVLVATTGNTALSGLVFPVIIDGVTLSDGDRVLIKNQLLAQNNGIYNLTGGSTTFIRSYDFSGGTEVVQGAYTFVLSGGTNKGTSWILSTPNPILINVTPLLFTLFNQITDISAGTGICISKYFGQDVICVNGAGLAGNSISWNGSTCQFDVNVNSGTLATTFNKTITGATNGLTTSGQIVKLGGTLTGTTKINGSQIFNINVSTLNLTGNTAFNLSTGCGVITDTGSNGGLKYAASYAPNVVARSIPDAAWVTGCTSSALGNYICNASNGLTKLGKYVTLGGTLTGNTCISGSYLFGTNVSKINLTGTTVNFGGCVILKSSPAIYVGNILTYNASTGEISQTTLSSLGGLTGATNGLHTSGQNVYLGGTLTGSTTFSGGVLNYGGDYSSGYTTHSLVDKAYVLSAIASGGTYDLQSPSAICVGGICAGTVLTGKTAFQLFEELLVPELCGTITPPSIGVILSASGLYEIGCTVSETVTGTFNRGCINPKYCSISDKRSGCANAYSFTGCGMPVGFQTCNSSSASATNASYTIVIGTQSWGVCTKYDAGNPALGSKGTQYCAALPSGCTSASSGSIIGVYPLYGTTVTIDTLTKQSLVAMGTSGVQLNMVTESGGNKQKFEVPCAWLGAPTNKPLLGVCQYNTVSAQWEYPGGTQATSLTLWTCSAASETIQGNLIGYCQYTYNGVDRSMVCIKLVF